MRRIPLYSTHLNEQYFDEVDTEISIEQQESLRSYTYQFCVAIQTLNNSIINDRLKFIKTWPKFIDYIKQLLYNYDIVNDMNLIKDVIIINVTPNKSTHIKTPDELFSYLKKNRQNIYIFFTIYGTLVYNITSDDVIHLSELLTNRIAKALHKIGLVNINAQCNYVLQTDSYKDIITERLDLNELQTEKFNKLIFQNTLLDNNIDEEEIDITKLFNTNDIDLLDCSYRISLYRIIRNRVITSDLKYMKSYEIFGTIKDSLDYFDKESLINYNKKDTEKLLNDIIKQLEHHNHPLRIWLYTSPDKVRIMMTIATNIIVTYNDERYLVAVEYIVTRTQDVTKNKTLSSNDKRITNKFIDIASSISGKDTNEITNHLKEIGVIITK